MKRIILPFVLLIATPGDLTQSVIKALPSWEVDVFAQYEQPELSAIRRDLDGAVDETQLRDDWNALLAIDAMLNSRYVL